MSTQIHKEWLDKPYNDKSGDNADGTWSVKSLKHFGIGFTIGCCHIEWTERTGEKFWQVTARLDADTALSLNEFKRLDDAVRFAKNKEKVAKAIEFEKSDAT